MSMVPSSGGSSFGSMFGGGSLSGAINSIGSAVSDLFAAQGDRAEAARYTEAAQLAHEEALFTESATNVQEMQATRQIQQAVGGVEAGYAGGGLSLGGSAGDVLRESAQQGALTTALIQYQGAETQYGYEEQSRSYAQMAQAARRAAGGAGIAAAIQGVNAAFNIASILIPH